MNDEMIYTSEIRLILAQIKHCKDTSIHSGKLIQKVKEYLHKLQQIIPCNENTDNTWWCWIKSQRGNITLFDDFNELLESGEVENYDDYTGLWKMEYPHETEWHKLTTVEYKETFYFYLDSELLFQYNSENHTVEGVSRQYQKPVKLLIRLVDIALMETNAFLKDYETYNQNLEKSLPLRKRTGKIKRKVLWENIEDFKRFDKQLGNEKTNTFKRLIHENDETRNHKTFTLNDFLMYCGICYDANEYFKNQAKKLTALEKYKSMADLRHGGLLDIAPDDPEAFSNWYHSGNRLGAHPWEICRGGNSTHISLQVAEKEDGWYLYLAGLYRQVETINMALALFENDIPFILNQKQDLYRMATGTDWIGVVPEDVTPRYCHSLFPSEDNVVDFINPWFDDEISCVVEKYATWYPLHPLVPKID